ncbi:MAG: hypothetical protein ACXAAR_06845 [Candidatus Thorarchaeota archaeon]|jgi:chaperonin cofactor prefoldin
MAQQIPPEIEHEIMKLENMRRQFEQLMAAIQTRQSELRESEVTLDELVERIGGHAGRAEKTS